MMDDAQISFFPVQTTVDLESLDSDEIIEGYMAGRVGDPEPGHNRGRSYWHGWRNGAVDGGHREKDAAQARLVHEVCPNGALLKTHSQGQQDLEDGIGGAA